MTQRKAKWGMRRSQGRHRCACQGCTICTSMHACMPSNTVGHTKRKGPPNKLLGVWCIHGGFVQGMMKNVELKKMLAPASHPPAHPGHVCPSPPPFSSLLSLHPFISFFPTHEPMNPRTHEPTSQTYRGCQLKWWLVTFYFSSFFRLLREHQIRNW